MAWHVTLPTLHRGQAAIYQAILAERLRLIAVRCGRRFGKTLLLNTIAGDNFTKRRKIGIFTPEHKQLSEPYDELRMMLKPMGIRSNKNHGVIRSGKSVLDFWTLNDNDLAGRGREYHIVQGDEMAFTKPNMRAIWEQGIQPTMLTTKGIAIMYSTPFGVDPDNFFYQICNDPKLKFREFHAPTSANPYVPQDELERLKGENHPLVFRQEYEAEFVDWSGVAFFSLDKLLDADGEPVGWPTRCDSVLAILDTAVKAGQAHDGTAVGYYAYDQHNLASPLTILDWDLVQIEGATLEVWLPTVYQRLEDLASKCQARLGSLGAFIEDKGSGTILLQQAAKNGWQATPLDSVFTASGKDERAISVSGYHYRGLCKISRHAFEKVTTFKGKTANHYLSQVTSFRIGDKDAAKRADDCLDVHVYALSTALGDREGY